MEHSDDLYSEVVNVAASSVSTEHHNYFDSMHHILVIICKGFS